MKDQFVTKYVLHMNAIGAMSQDEKIDYIIKECTRKVHERKPESR